MRYWIVAAVTGTEAAARRRTDAVELESVATFTTSVCRVKLAPVAFVAEY